MNVIKIIVLAFLILVINKSWCQTDSLSTQQNGRNRQKLLADSLIIAKNYVNAIPLYSDLLSQYPRDAEIQYRLGLCYLNGTRNIHQALGYLKEASTAEVDAMVYFYLAEALRLTYQFNEAIDYYRRFVVSGGTPEIKLDEVEQLVNLCENGAFLTRYIYTPTVYDAKQATVKNFYDYYTTILPNGRFVPVPDNLRTPTDRRMEYQPVMFYRNGIKVGDYLYYASYGNSTSWGSDIFRIQLLENGNWSKPENLGDVINSSLHEDYPLMMSDGVTLYFASKGHYGMGGFDIYKSTYNSQQKQWSTPENLGFPVNSPFDDILFATGANDTLACFSSNRLHMPDTLMVYLIRNETNPTRRFLTDYLEVDTLSKLLPHKSTNSTTAVRDSETEQNEIKNTNNVEEQKSTKPVGFNAVENDPEYSRVLSKGFAAQKFADSLKIKLEDLRGRFDYVTTAEQRIKLEKRVTKVEDDMLAAQKEADQMFARASQIEQEYLTGKRTPKGAENSTFTSDNPNYIYQAQFAPTVFRSDEISRLAEIEKISPQLGKARELAIEKRNTFNQCLINSSGDTLSCGSEYSQMIQAAKNYSNTLAKYFEKKHPIYSDCIEVARVKSGNRNEEVKQLISSANKNIRAATAILNNLAPGSENESIFEASLLRNLGLLQLDLAFAKIWRVQYLEPPLQSQIIKLEKHIFGKVTPTHISTAQQGAKNEAKQNAMTPTLQKNETLKNSPIIKMVEEIPSYFVITDKPIYNPQNPIPINSPLPKGVVYRIQIGAFSTPREPSFFKNMAPVYGIKTGKITRYYIGNLTHYEDAEKALATVKQKGFKDAFIIAWYNGTQVTTQRAQQLENSSTPSNKATSDGKLYIVEIGRFEKPLSDVELNTVKNLSQGKEILRQQNENGSYVFTVGNYESIDEANRVKENMIASGFLKAAVILINP